MTSAPVAPPAATFVSAPVWRRLAATSYDALVLAALWMVTAMAVTLLNQISPSVHSEAWLRAAILLVGAVFFAWFWSRGGQTLGLRAWRLRVTRIDGAPVPLPAALLRYTFGLLPPIATLYAVAHFGRPAIVVLLVGYAPCFFDARKRALHDLLSGTRVVQLPPRGGSAQLAQSPEAGDDQQQGRQAG